MKRTHQHSDDHLQGTPALERLLGGLRGRLRTQVVLHGIGTVLVVGVLWLGFSFLADWGLRVPRAIRSAHGGVLLVLLGLFFWRDLLRPLRRIPGRSGMAILLERAHPELRQLLVSAVQFQQAGDDAEGDPELIQGVLADADRESQALATGGVFTSRAPRNRFYAGVGGVLVAVLLAVFNPAHTKIFFDHMLGGTTPWPQKTHLYLEIPNLGAGAQIARDDEEIQIRVARGTDVPVLVRAEGVVPDDVTLHFEGGRDLVLTSTGGNVFRTLLRSLQQDIQFHVTGGDDDDGIPNVDVEVLQPPDVEGIAVHIKPPAYSGLPETTVFNRDVEVLNGSELTVHVLPFPEDATAIARLLPEDRVLELTEAPYPTDPDLADAVGAPQMGLSFELFADRPIGYRVELRDASGLTNPDPGLFRVRVVEDRAPELQVLAPGRTEFEVVKGGAIPLRVRGEDDFGLVSMAWSVRPVGAAQDEPSASDPGGTFELQPIEAEETDGAPVLDTVGAGQRALGSVRIEVDALGTEAAPVAVEQRYEFTVVAKDNREPEAGEGRALPLRARVVTPEELLRRMQDRLGQARLAAVRLSDLQREKRQRVEELLDSLEGDGATPNGEGLALSAALAGQRRVRGDALALTRELAAVAEDILYARLDDKAGALLEFYDARQAKISDRRFHAEPWRELAEAQRAGQLGAPGFAGSLVQLVDLSLDIGLGHAGEAVDALVRAEKAADAALLQDALLETSELQSLALKRIDLLLEQLAEWDNFQNILALTRDILNRQKALRERTQQAAGGK